MAKSKVIFKPQRIAEGEWQIQAHCPDGQIRDKGSYRLTTHNGTISMALPEKANVTMSVRTYNGGFRSSFPVKQGCFVARAASNVFEMRLTITSAWSRMRPREEHA